MFNLFWLLFLTFPSFLLSCENGTVVEQKMGGVTMYEFSHIVGSYKVLVQVTSDLLIQVTVTDDSRKLSFIKQEIFSGYEVSELIKIVSVMPKIIKVWKANSKSDVNPDANYNLQVKWAMFKSFILKENSKQSASIMNNTLHATIKRVELLESKLDDAQKYIQEANTKEKEQQLRLKIDSTILKTTEEFELLRGILSIGTMRINLLYRGSRDGFTGRTFHHKCDGVLHTVTLVESNYGKVFGGYSDNDWSGGPGYKTSTKAFLFSITNRYKYFIKSSGCDNSIYVHPSYLATFGGGHDFHIADNCNINNLSYSKFDISYDASNKDKSNFSGGVFTGSHFYFSVKEIEVFQI